MHVGRLYKCAKTKKKRVISSLKLVGENKILIFLFIEQQLQTKMIIRKHMVGQSLRPKWQKRWLRKFKVLKSGTYILLDCKNGIKLAFWAFCYKSRHICRKYGFSFGLNMEIRLEPISFSSHQFKLLSSAALMCLEHIAVVKMKQSLLWGWNIWGQMVSVLMLPRQAYWCKVMWFPRA